MRLILCTAILALSGCSSSFDTFDGVDKAYCDKVKMNYSLSILAKDVCIDNYIKKYTKDNSIPTDVAEASMSECGRVISSAANSSYDEAMCEMAYKNGMSVQRLSSMVSDRDRNTAISNTDNVKRDAINRVVKYQSTL
ncbi:MULTISPECIES: hypothetical protein [unclassified Cedecea]|uniref:hypothetical protein n=1 Tax=unclassified Cedecea TaxID=2649846 RepID=UPI0030199DA5